ncbi:MAG TPA: hypothetical protein GX707_03690 [Epulopiscium sp.]|nr:hypothetical protein [Candidatus Epulonipiscium sp.]
MVTKGERIRGRIIILFFIMLVIITGWGGCFYYMKHKQPTQGIFVYDQEMKREECVSGYLYQSS